MFLHVKELESTELNKEHFFVAVHTVFPLSRDVHTKLSCPWSDGFCKLKTRLSFQKPSLSDTPSTCPVSGFATMYCKVAMEYFVLNKYNHSHAGAQPHGHTAVLVTQRTVPRLCLQGPVICRL